MNIAHPDPCPVPQSGEAHVWTLDLDGFADETETLASFLSDRERRREARFVDTGVRRRYVAAHGLLRHLLGRYLGVHAADVDIAIHEKGKPVLAGESTGLSFNMADSGEHLLVAVADGTPVGCDVERLRPVKDALSLARRFFTAAEHEAIAALPEAERQAAFFACWTRKEAVMKAHGGGMALLPEIEPGCVALPAGGAILQVGGQTYAVRDMEGLKGCLGAVAVAGNRIELRPMSME